MYGEMLEAAKKHAHMQLEKKRDEQIQNYNSLYRSIDAKLYKLEDAIGSGKPCTQSVCNSVYTVSLK